MDKEINITRRNTLLGAVTLATGFTIGGEIVSGPSPALAQAAPSMEPGKLPPLPDQITASLEARVGPIDLKGGLPTPTGIKQIFAIQDFQRATQLYQWAIPTIGALGWARANIANGKIAETDWVLYDDYVARQGILTPNAEVTYVVLAPDLQATGPLVLDYGAGGIAGIVGDSWQRPLFDFGLTGPERGKTGSKLLIIGPGQTVPDDITGFHVIHSPTRFMSIGYRVIDRAQKDKIVTLNTVYSYKDRASPPANRVLRATKDYTQSQPRGFAYWEAVNEIVQREVVEDRDRFFYAMLRDLGIEKGKPFAPDAEQRQLFEDAALLGEHIARVVVYEKRFIGNYYRKDARWQFALVVDPDQRQDNYDQLDERTDWFYEAIGCSYAMVTTTPGVGSIYLSTYRDKDGDWLDGGRNYRLRIPADAPMKQFWAVSVYDMDSRTLFRNPSLKAEVSSNLKGLKKNADGSVDVHFGPTAPAAGETNWVQTVQGKHWFPYFRLYAPTEPYFDRSWPLPDIEKA